MSYEYQKTTKCNVCNESLKDQPKMEYFYEDEIFRQYQAVGNMSKTFINFLREVKLELCKCPLCGFIVLLSPIFHKEVAFKEFFSEKYSHFQLTEKAKDFPTQLRFKLISMLSGKSNLALSLYKYLLFPIFDRLMIPRWFNKIENNMSFLDIGYGSGIYVDGFAKNGFDSYGIDPFATIPKNLRGNYIKDDFLQHDFGNKQFDIITMKSCLYLVPEPTIYLKKIYSMLKDDGQFIMTELIALPEIVNENIVFGTGPRVRQFIYDLALSKEYFRKLGFINIYEYQMPFDYFGRLMKSKFTWMNEIISIIMDIVYKLFTGKRNLCMLTFKKNLNI
jgi:SAM-dependent methyltransferase